MIKRLLKTLTKEVTNGRVYYPDLEKEVKAFFDQNYATSPLPKIETNHLSPLSYYWNHYNNTKDPNQRDYNNEMFLSQIENILLRTRKPDQELLIIDYCEKCDQKLKYAFTKNGVKMLSESCTASKSSKRWSNL